MQAEVSYSAELLISLVVDIVATNSLCLLAKRAVKGSKAITTQ
jgi:hypothetical protein